MEKFIGVRQQSDDVHYDTNPVPQMLKVGQSNKEAHKLDAAEQGSWRIKTVGRTLTRPLSPSAIRSSKTEEVGHVLRPAPGWQVNRL